MHRSKRFALVAGRFLPKLGGALAPPLLSNKLSTCSAKREPTRTLGCCQRSSSSCSSVSNNNDPCELAALRWGVCTPITHINDKMASGPAPLHERHRDKNGQIRVVIYLAVTVDVSFLPTEDRAYGGTLQTRV